MKISLTLTQYLIPLSLVIGSYLLGLIFEKIVLIKLRHLSAKTKWEGDEIIIEAMHGISTLWFVLAGVYGALLTTAIKPDILTIIQKLILTLTIFSITFFLAKAAAGFVKLYTRSKQGALLSTSILTNLTKLTIFVLGILVILQSLGIAITPILTALGVGGLAVALALQDTLSNLFSGLYIIVSKQIKPGDYIKLNSGEEGYVTDVTWRNTSIRALANNMIVVPNSQLAASVIINYYQPGTEMAVLVEVGVSYASNLEHVEKITVETAKDVLRNTSGSVSDFEPFIRYHTFSDSSINFSVIMRVKEFVDQYLVKHEFIKKLHRRYQEEGIEIPFPIRTVYFKDQRKLVDKA